jgi:hypothetical protein
VEHLRSSDPQQPPRNQTDLRNSDRVSWRWCFWINLPFGAIAVGALLAFFHPPPRKASTLTLPQKILEMDLLGATFLICSIVCLLLALRTYIISYLVRLIRPAFIEAQDTLLVSFITPYFFEPCRAFWIRVANKPHRMGWDNICLEQLQSLGLHYRFWSNGHHFRYSSISPR